MEVSLLPRLDRVQGCLVVVGLPHMVVVSEGLVAAPVPHQHGDSLQGCENEDYDK